MKENDAALKIQRFWQKRQCHTGLSGKNNYDYYVRLLSLSDRKNFYNLLAQMMYGRVIATPQGSFPFLKQQNPHVGMEPDYHRNDVLGSNLSSIILKQWGLAVEHDCIYIPVVNSSLGTINDAIQALSWNLNEYELIEPPKQDIHTQYLKFIKIKRGGDFHDNHFTTDNRWGKLSSLGIIASPWLLSTVAIAGGFKPGQFLDSIPLDLFAGAGVTLSELTPSHPVPNLVKQSLVRQPKTIDQLKKSTLVKKLNQLKEKSTSEASLLATGLSSMIEGLPSDIEAPDIIARLSLFIETALLMHQDEHAFFANFIYSIIHEISLLLLKKSELQKSPYISFEDYQPISLNDISSWLDLNNADYEFIAFPAHSGTHANLIAAKLARDFYQKDHSKSPTVRIEGREYWEVMNDTRHYTLHGQLTSDNNANVVRISAGPIGDYIEGTFPAVDINKLIRAEFKKNAQLQTIIIDITSASYHHLKIASDVKKLLAQNNISLIFWESGQKFSLLHTDQAQYGRVLAFCNKKQVSSALINTYKMNAVQDMNIPDVQIGAFINKHCQKIMPVIRDKHFKNGLIFRQIALGDANKGINTQYSYELRVSDHQDPFVWIRGNFTEEQIQKISSFFKQKNLGRDSFGHRYTTEMGGFRISAGAEHVVDATILATSLKYYVELTPKDLHQKIINESRTLDIWNKEELINYLSLIKAWSMYSATEWPITLTMARQFSSIIEHESDLRRALFNGSRQFVRDLYTVFKEKSPFQNMMQEALAKKDQFAINLFQTLDSRYKKTGKINVEQAIKKALRSTNNIPSKEKIDEKIIQEYQRKLFAGDYSSRAAKFFSAKVDKMAKPDIEKTNKNIFLAVERYLANPSEKNLIKINELSRSMINQAHEDEKGKKIDAHLILDQRLQQMAREAAPYSVRLIANRTSDNGSDFIFKTSQKQQLFSESLGSIWPNPIFQYCDRKESAVYNHNAKLYLKVTELVKRGHFKAAEVLTDACNQIKDVMSSIDKDQEKYKKIKEVLIQTKNNPSIQKHRGMLKTVLMNFLMVVSVAGALYLTATSETRGSFFYRPHTDTENKVEDFKKKAFCGL